ncbi:MAG: beta-galactosidase [Planctomycetia bacterium]|nr:beta-galactosidase [Planctomycetia bacterium]
MLRPRLPGSYFFPIPHSVIAVVLLLSTGGLAMKAVASGQSVTVTRSRIAHIQSPILHSPTWALDFNFSPFTTSGLQIQYNSDRSAYSTAPVALFPTRKGVWHTYTWKLAAVHLSGLQNAGADLRLTDSAGVAVHEVVLSLRPPKVSSRDHNEGDHATARIIFNTGLYHNTAMNTCLNMRQIAQGGTVLDSKYTCGTIGGRSAEILAASPSYIYLRISRRSKLFLKHPTVIYATVTYAANHAMSAWPESVFAHMASVGIHYAEINMPWGVLEPSPDRFNFRVLDQTLINAAQAQVRVIPIFWYSVWPGNPPLWITRYDMGPTGIPSDAPAWWSHFNRRSYFKYVTTTIEHIKDNPAFGGAFLSFGWLDYMWGPVPGSHRIWWHSGEGVNGYAPADVARFHLWLQSRYHSLRDFNQKYHTGYTSWNAIPAAAPGQPLFPVYQRFRSWSVIETYSRLTALVRRKTPAPLYYYCGGGFYGAGVAFNQPDSFFQVARRYHATVELDWADSTGLALLFGSLAIDYRVPLFEEWSASNRLHDDMAKFLCHYAIGAPEEAGMDFILYHGGRKYTIGFPPYVHAIPILSQIQGDYPLQPVAVYISYHRTLTDPGALSGMAVRLARIWRRVHTAFTVVTNREVKAGVVRLGQFRAIFPLNGRHDRMITNYAAHGGHVLLRPSQLINYTSAYISYAPATDGVEAVPTVNKRAHTAWIAFSRWPAANPYTGEATLNLTALGLSPGHYHIVKMATRRTIPSIEKHGRLRAPLDIASGKLEVWQIVPGTGHSGPPSATPDIH